MSTESNKATLRHFRDALSGGDFEGAISVFSPSAVLHVAGAPDPLTVEGFQQFGRAMMGAFSGATSTVEDVIAEGDRVVSRVTFRGTHTGDLMGIPPTGRSVIVSEMIVDRFLDGKIVESWRLLIRWR